uniref:hypothetical protein n=1 Tax=Mediterraneibacter glycyrrhizinilyticus TaxID=342942 RepID=UPI0006D0D296
MILSYESGRLTEKKSYREALRLESSVSPILSITGAGGKTTTALHLAYEYKEVGNPAVVTTSTHLAIWDQRGFCWKNPRKNYSRSGGSTDRSGSGSR